MTLNPSRLAALLFAAIALPALAAENNIAVVNGKPIPASRVDALAKQFISQGQKDSPELRDNIKHQLIDREILLQEADKLKLGNQPEVKMQIDLAKQSILINALAEDFIKKHPVSDSEIAAEYDKIKAHAADKEYHVRHIQTDTEDQAKAIVAKLKGGAKFEDLAKQSKDVASANNGGDLDWMVLTGLDKSLADAISGLQKGQFTETPVKMQDGYHILKLDDVRPAKVASLEELKPKISEYLQREKLQTYQKSLKDNAKVQ